MTDVLTDFLNVADRIIPDPPDPLYLAEILPDWHLEAECRRSDPTLFFPDRGKSIRRAKAICAVCPVRAECLDWAIENHEKFGIWGGASEKDRRRIRREREEAA